MNKFNFRLRYYFWFLYALSAITIVSLQGCETLGYEGVDTTRKTVVVAIAEVRAQNLLLQDLIGRNAIGREPATRALNSLQEAKDLLQSGLVMLDATGDPATALNNMDRVNLLLSVAINILAPLVEET